ncbi:hypothetical protein MBANPS3_004767, partial [Mucor bainieri]
GLMQKLPNQERLSPALGEMELITNYLDPLLSPPLFHCPDKDKLLVCLNRQDENTVILRPDANMMATTQKAASITLGYVDVNPVDSSMINPELAFDNLVRLGMFKRALMLKKSSKTAIAVQRCTCEIILSI